MKRTILLMLLAAFTSICFAQNEIYKRVKIWMDGKPSVELARLGIDLSEGNFRRGVSFESDFNEREIAKIQRAGFRTEVMIDDVKAFYKDRNLSSERNTTSVNIQSSSCGIAAPVYQVPSHFRLGNMGGYFTYSEMLDILDSMALLYPNLITVKQEIDTTHSIEGRPIYYVKISDNPDTDETEPEVLYSALHHAREAESLSQLIYYMWYLLENYGTSTEVQALIDNTEMYFVPCVNPDGYLYNESTDANGGGMWRKNRRDNLDGEFGVDLNRNYDYQWGLDDIGSSPNTMDDTYRGSSPASEPEIQAMKNFTSSRHFALALNYHTYGSHVVIPWGYGSRTPDSAAYDFYGKAVARYNNYHVGTPIETVGYAVNGSSDDWMYGDQVTKPKVFAMSPEVGTSDDGFWPPVSRIVPLCDENVFANLTLARLAGRYGTITHNEAHYVSQLNNEFYFTFRKLGLDTTGTFTISLVPVSANIVSVGTPVVYSNLSVMQSVDDSLSFTLSSSILPGDEIRYAVVIDNGWYTQADTITQMFGNPIAVFNEAGADMANWTASGTNSVWDVTTEDFVSSPSSITDSPFNLYQPNDSNFLTLVSPVSLAGAIDAHLNFYAKWNIEPGYDFAQVLASSDNGNTWIPLCGRYTVTGSQSQDAGEPVYDGAHTSWVLEDMSLNDFLGQNILLRFYLHSDPFAEYDGFYFDDLKVETIINDVGITEPTTDLFLSPAVPNPASSQAVVHYSNVAAGSMFEVFNTFGQIVFKKPLTDLSGKVVIPTSELSSGMYSYFIRLHDGSVSHAQKMIVRK